MKFETPKYTIKKLSREEFETAQYEINLKEGFEFSNGGCLEYAEDYEDLLGLIKEIKVINNGI